MKRKHWTLSPWFLIFSAVMMFMAVASYNYNHILSYVELGIAVASAGLILYLSLKFRLYINSVVKSAAEKIGSVDEQFLERFKCPVVLAGSKGDIVWYNSLFKKNICNDKTPESERLDNYLSGYNINEIVDNDSVDVIVDGKEYTVFCMSVEDGIVCQFIDNTYYKHIAREYAASRPCVAVITFDNAEDFAADSDNESTAVSLAVEEALQKWAASYDALYKKIGTNRYIVIFRDCDIKKLCAEKFQILRQIHSIKLDRLEATISVGICQNGANIKQSELSARKALEMALGRGGDQVVLINDSGNYEFFGGTSAAAERVSKVRMRVIANAIGRAVTDCDKVYIMGHRFSDLDCVGAAIGLQSVMEKSFLRYSKVVVDRSKTMSSKLINYTEQKLDSSIFITADEALRGMTARSILIIVDTHIRESLESPELYDAAKRTIVIDHHRRAINCINNALIFCHEPSASSACEMCTEIISCMNDKPITYIQADALLAGIMLDTKNFVLKAGVRTFEAAAYLKRKGANTVTVKQMFSDTMDTYKEKSDIVCNARVYRGCAISNAIKKTKDIRLASAQAADELLTLQGVNASFVIFNDGGLVNISARSYGRVNVQIIMEKLGGGGHQTMAAAQLKDCTNELAFQKLLAVIDEVLDDVSKD